MADTTATALHSNYRVHYVGTPTEGALYLKYRSANILKRAFETIIIVDVFWLFGYALHRRVCYFQTKVTIIQVLIKL